MSKMLKSSGAMSVATMLSRVLGMLREVVYARFMGDSWVAGAFILAFMIPNLFRRLLGEGALTAAFIPIFKEKEAQFGEAGMWHTANAVISGLVVSAAALVALVVIGISVALALGVESRDTRLMLELLRLMFPYMLLVCLAALFMGMLNARGRFFLPAMGATLLNVVMIGTVLFIAPRFGESLDERIYALAYGVLAAGLVQSGFQLPVLYKDGFRYSWVNPFKNDVVKLVAKRMVPGTVGIAAFQLNVLVIQAVAFWFSPTIVAAFNYAVRLMELPQGVFAISLATFLLPTLSGLAARKEYAEFRSTLKEGLGHVFFLNGIAAALFFVLATAIVRLLFERGEFSPAATERVSLALACLAPALVAYSWVNIFARAFYALGDTATPMKISVVCLLMNLVFSIWLIFPFKQAGLGVANSITSFLNVALLIYAMKKKLKRLSFEGFTKNMVWLGLACILGGEVAWIAGRVWESNYGHATLMLQICGVFVPAAIGGVVYFISGLALGLSQPREFLGLAKRMVSKLFGG